ncbi:hypothetical protein CL3_15790 [butyrate-producing bacterium SM4/1]|nr:hypothetical protein CL3_15790 [butyrate-producing bacterium SM4/1]
MFALAMSSAARERETGALMLA